MISKMPNFSKYEKSDKDNKNKFKDNKLLF